MKTIKDIVQKGRGEFEEKLRDFALSVTDHDGEILESSYIDESNKIKSHIDSHIIEVLEGVRKEGVKMSYDASGRGDPMMNLDDFNAIITSVIDEIKK